MRKDLKILIVDDEPRNLRILEEILDDLCLLSSASDGEHALQQVDSFHPDLILLDGMMPGKTGVEICEELKTNENFKHIKIIFVTGKASNIERMQGLSVGAEAYITKPFDESVLLAEIERVME